MSGFNFLRESELHIIQGSNRYNVKITPALSFSQTFAEDAYEVKTLHDQTKMFQGTSITKANPANFSFETHLTLEKDESIVLDLLTDYDTSSGEQLLKSFDMYIVSNNQTLKIEGCVITQGEFRFDKGSPLILAVSGSGKKLERVGDESFSIPGSAQSESSTRTPLIVYPVLTVDSLDMSSILSTTLQIQNQIQFTPFETLHDSLSVTDSSNAMFPSTYTLEMRVASGEIRQYQTDNNVTQFDDFNTSSNLTIKAVQVGNPSSDSGFFSINLNPISYTARMNPTDAYTQSYDYTSTDNTALGTRITQYS